MFRTLLESRAARQRRAGGSVASVVIHSVIITAAIVATARQAVVSPPTEIVEFIPFIPQLPPTVASHSVATASVVPAAPAMFQRFVVPTIMPTTIPPVDFNAAPTSPDFTAGPVAPSGIACQLSDCSSRPLVDGDRTLWTARDIMMQLRDEPVPPRYPESLRRAGIEGDVVVKFVVDTTGMIDMRQVEILSSAHELFTNAVRESLARMRFSPSMAGERKVKALAIMPFRFRLR